MISFSAKVQLENKKGATALDIAKAYADPRVVAVVQKRWDEIPPPVNKKKKKGMSAEKKSGIHKQGFQNKPAAAGVPPAT